MPHVSYRLRVLHCCLSQSVTNALAALDLTSAQGHLLGYLTHCETPPCPKDLEEQFQLSHPTVSGLLSRMEKKGFIECRPDPSDRRCKRIHLLPKGRELDETIRGVIRENEEQIVRGFTEEEIDQFMDFLARAAQNMGSEPPPKNKKEESSQ